MTVRDGTNRRKFPRVTYPCMITLRREAGEPDVILTHTENIGIGGICVTLNRPLRIFSLVDLEIDLLDLGDHLQCCGKVVWTIQRKAEEKRKPLFYDTGIEFLQIEGADRQRLDNVIRRLLKQAKTSPNP